MKKITFILIGFIIVLMVFASCGKESVNSETSASIESTINIEQQTNIIEVTSEEMTDLFNFEFIINKNNIRTIYSVSAPYFDMYSASSCRTGAPMSGAYAVIGGEPVEGLAVPGETVDNVFPTYFDIVKRALDVDRIAAFQQLDFTVDSKETLNRNGYDMCKFNGTHTCYSTFEQKTLTMHYVAYATQIKENGGWAFWLFIDETDDMSNMKLLEEYAASMADTFTERNFMEW